MKRYRFIVLFCEDCTPKALHFRSLKAAQAFANKFIKYWLKKDNIEDNWVDCIIEGEFVQHYINSPYEGEK